MHTFFFNELQLITVLLSISNSYTSWSTWLTSLKMCVEFAIFDFLSYNLFKPIPLIELKNIH